MNKKKHKHSISVIEILRELTRHKMSFCPQCRSYTTSIRQIAKEAKVSHSTLWRFLKGSQPSATLVDDLARWLNIGWKEID